MLSSNILSNIVSSSDVVEYGAVMYSVAATLEKPPDINGFTAAVLERCDAVVLLYDTTCKKNSIRELEMSNKGMFKVQYKACSMTAFSAHNVRSFSRPSFFFFPEIKTFWLQLKLAHGS